MSVTIIKPNGSGGALLPGAAALPPAIGSKLTVKNALIGGGLAVAAYLVYAFVMTPPKKKTTAPASTAAAVAGLFGVRYRRRSRR